MIRQHRGDEICFSNRIKQRNLNNTVWMKPELFLCRPQIGPRMTLQLMKIQEGMGEGNILYHAMSESSTSFTSLLDVFWCTWWQNLYELHDSSLKVNAYWYIKYNSCLSRSVTDCLLMLIVVYHVFQSPRQKRRYRRSWTGRRRSLKTKRIVGKSRSRTLLRRKRNKKRTSNLNAYMIRSLCHVQFHLAAVWKIKISLLVTGKRAWRALRGNLPRLKRTARWRIRALRATSQLLLSLTMRWSTTDRLSDRSQMKVNRIVLLTNISSWFSFWI